ncbi:MAG: aminoglycoside 6-adenylyltransferase [Chloroflexi bacterium]|nr:aminoglycoside 6-adenylyltransferase [Chloroflexota bacterium]
MNDPDQTNAVIHRLIQWAEAQDAVRAMLLTSTRAIPNAPLDSFSDYDLILIVPDIQPFFHDRRCLADFGPVLVGYWDPIHPDPIYGIEYFASVIQYESGLKIDFTLWPLELGRRVVEDPVLPAELDAGYRILVDKDNRLVGLPAPTYRAYIPTPPTAETFQRLIEEFFSDAPYVAKCLWRDELLPAKWCLDYDMKHVYLRPLLEWQVEIAHHWSVKPGALGKGLKRHLPATRWAQLENSYAGAGIAENWDALFKTIDLFRQVAIEVADHLGYTYPHDLDQRVTTYVQKMQQMT